MYSSWAAQCLSVDWVYHHRSQQSQSSQAVRLCLEVQTEGVCKDSCHWMRSDAV